MSKALTDLVHGLIPQQPQTQESLDDQLRALRRAAGLLGLYDAQDWLDHAHRGNGYPEMPEPAITRLARLSDEVKNRQGRLPHSHVVAEAFCNECDGGR